MRVKSFPHCTMFFLATLTLSPAGYAGAIEPPQHLGNLQLVHAFQGKEALREINRLHGRDVKARDGYVAHYEKNGAAAMVYFARGASVAQAVRQLSRMSAAIRKSGGPFYHLRTSQQGKITLYSALGQGQIHYFYQRGASVVWLAADPPVAKQAVAALLDPPEAADK